MPMGEYLTDEGDPAKKALKKKAGEKKRAPIMVAVLHVMDEVVAAT